MLLLHAKDETSARLIFTKNQESVFCCWHDWYFNILGIYRNVFLPSGLKQ